MTMTTVKCEQHSIFLGAIICYLFAEEDVIHEHVHILVVTQLAYSFDAPCALRIYQ